MNGGGVNSLGIRIGVAGGNECDKDTYALAEEVGTYIAQVGAVLVCGGRLGVMEAAAKGAKLAGGVTIGILPGYDRSEANPFIEHAISTGLGQARNLLVVLNSDVLLAIGGEAGTLSEIALALKHNISVVALRSWKLEAIANMDGFYPCDDAKNAVQLALELSRDKCRVSGPKE
mgnify:FL=1